MPTRKYYRPQTSLKEKTAKNKKGGYLLRKMLKWFLLISFFFAIAALISGAAIFAYFAKDLPDLKKMDQRQIIESTKIYDRSGQILLYDVHGEEKRTVVPLEDISDTLIKAMLAIEDAGFYEHSGFDVKALIRAGLANFRGGKIVQGGSTITQQLIKNSLLTSERTLTRKIKELILSFEMERRYSKEEILSFYLNQIPFGSNAYGVEAAALTFFNKHAKNLTLAESSLLAALPKAPTYYSPYGSHPEALKTRHEYVLDRMKELGLITSEEAENAKKEPLQFKSEKTAINAPHFVMYIREYLEEKYGDKYLQEGGLKVVTTLDWNLQLAAEKIIEEGALQNEKKYKASNAALTAIDPKTGQVLAMVGSRDYFGEPSPKNCVPGKNCRFEPNVNVTIRERQPGSAFKPFAYAAAFKKGFTAGTVIFDVPIEFSAQNQNCPPEVDFSNEDRQCYHPQNYDGKFRGPVTLHQSLAQSLNIPSVKTLYLAGVPETINTAQDLGITTLKNRAQYGLALALGGGAVKLLDITAAYGVFGNEGVKNRATSVLRIEDSKGNILEQYQKSEVKALEPEIAKQIADILSDNEARTPMFGADSPLHFADRPVAAKTGTSQDYRDAWVVGFTPSLSVGVWVGNNNNEPMEKGGAGIMAAGPLWHKFMAEVLKNKPVESFIKPENKNQPSNPLLNGQFASEIKVKIDKISGKLATEFTPTELIQEKAYKQVHSILYFVDKNNPLGPPPQDPSQDPQFANWEFAVQKWLKESGQVDLFNQTPTTETDDVHIPANQPLIKIASPLANEAVNPQNLTIRVEVFAPLGIKHVDFFFNDLFLGSDFVPPYILTDTVPKNQIVPEQLLFDGQTLATNYITARAYDAADNKSEMRIPVIIKP